MDREKLIEALDKCYGQPETCGVSSCPYWDLKRPYCECEDRMRKDAIALLKEQEAVVRCKDCKHGRQYDSNVIDCEYRELATEPDWFCADGERKD